MTARRPIKVYPQIHVASNAPHRSVVTTDVRRPWLLQGASIWKTKTSYARLSSLKSSHAPSRACVASTRPMPTQNETTSQTKTPPASEASSKISSTCAHDFRIHELQQCRLTCACKLQCITYGSLPSTKKPCSTSLTDHCLAKTCSDSTLNAQLRPRLASSAQNMFGVTR